MSSYPGSSPTEGKRPSFFRRPVPMWAFLLLIVIIVLILFIPALIAPTPPSIQQPLAFTPDSRPIFIQASQNFTENFSVANLNSTSTISATATATLFFANSTIASASVNVTLTVSGVQTRGSFTVSSDHKTVSFPPGASTLVVRVVSKPTTPVGYYIIEVTLAD